MHSSIEVSAVTAVVGMWDLIRVEQVVTNLLTNAFKFGGGKPIEITVEERGSIGRLVVVDHGIGIAPEDQERIFHRYEQATSSRRAGGLGLGLYIARQIIEAHGGTIRVESQPGQGSTFTIDFPREPPPAKKESHGAYPRPPATTCRVLTKLPMAKLILIVEDDVDVAESVADVLQSAGYSTAIAGNGREALDHLQKNNHPDLILLDMMMPVMDGWQFRRSNESYPRLIPSLW